VTALQKIAMGLVVTLLDSYVGGYDAVPDLLGWVLVVAGLRDLRERADTSSLLPLAALSGLVSVALLSPAWTQGLPESTGWLLSLPQLAFSFLLCREVAELLVSAYRRGSAREDTGGRAAHTLARRLRLLGWGFVLAAAGPVLLYGGGVDALATPVAVLAVLVNLALVYLLFRSSTLVHGPNRERAGRKRAEEA
jgi:hypothetical protein